MEAGAQRERVWRLYMTGAALAIFTPEYQWYTLFLVLLVAFDGRWEWLALALGAYLANDSHLTPSMYITHPGVLGYGGGLVIAVAISVIRHRRSRWSPSSPQGDTRQGRRAGMRFLPQITAEARSLPAAYTGGVA